MSELRLSGLVLRHQRAIVLDWTDQPPLEVASGELMIFVGKPGSGKTTLARVVAGLEGIEEGEVRLDGNSISHKPPNERGVGLVFQDDGLWPHWNVAQNIAFGLKCRGVGRSERRARVDEILSSLKLDGMAARRPESLSTLQRWRVALARALVLDPKLLLVDEPFERLDEFERKELVDEIRRVHDEHGLTTLAFTRQANPALTLGDRLAVMSLGRIKQVGRASEVYYSPISREVAETLGSINMLPGLVESVDPRGEVVLRTQVGRIVGRCRLGTISIGDEAVAVIRPESLGLGSAGLVGSNRFPATLVRKLFQGPTCQIELRGPGDWLGTALAMHASAKALRDGQSLSVSVAPDAAFVLARNGG